MLRRRAFEVVIPGSKGIDEVMAVHVTVTGRDNCATTPTLVHFIPINNPWICSDQIVCLNGTMTRSHACIITTAGWGMMTF